MLSLCRESVALVSGSHCLPNLWLGSDGTFSIYKKSCFLQLWACMEVFAFAQQPWGFAVPFGQEGFDPSHTLLMFL